MFYHKCFSAEQSLKCDRTLNSESGVVYHPDLNGDGYYDISVDCLLKIKVLNNTVIRYRIEYIDIEYSEGCVKDKLKVSNCVIKRLKYQTFNLNKRILMTLYRST